MTIWKGAARPLPPHAFSRAAAKLGCEIAALRAVWEVEAAGRFYLKDGTVIRRFEPHKMPGSKTTWRDSLKIGPKRREALFQQAYARNPEAACQASSWGAPQIMGFNKVDAGHSSAIAMVRAFADSEDAQLRAFVALVESWGLATRLRSHDWVGFARRYNGSGQPAIYGRRIEKAYRKHSGKKSPVVLRLGDRGAAVRRLQTALGIEIDGAFGRETDAAVRLFQGSRGLKVDGVVGARTWAALEAGRDAKPPAQPASVALPALVSLILSILGRFK